MNKSEKASVSELFLKKKKTASEYFEYLSSLNSTQHRSVHYHVGCLLQSQFGSSPVSQTYVSFYYQFSLELFEEWYDFAFISLLGIA